MRPYSQGVTYCSPLVLVTITQDSSARATDGSSSHQPFLSSGLCTQSPHPTLSAPGPLCSLSPPSFPGWVRALMTGPSPCPPRHCEPWRARWVSVITLSSLPHRTRHTEVTPFVFIECVKQYILHTHTHIHKPGGIRVSQLKTASRVATQIGHYCPEASGGWSRGGGRLPTPWGKKGLSSSEWAPGTGAPGAEHSRHGAPPPPHTPPERGWAEGCLRVRGGAARLRWRGSQ